MADKTWKKVERKVAKKLNGKRNPLSGSASRHTAGDVIHPLFYVEVKHRKRIPFYKEFEKTIKSAEAENKIPVLVMHEKNRKFDIAMIKLDDLAWISNIKYTTFTELIHILSYMERVGTAQFKNIVKEVQQLYGRNITKTKIKFLLDFLTKYGVLERKKSTGLVFYAFRRYNTTKE